MSFSVEQIVIKARDFDLTSQLKSHVQSKFSKLEKFSNYIQELVFELHFKESQVLEYGASVVIHLNRGGTTKSEHWSEDMYQSINTVYKHLEDYLSRQKDRLVDHHHEKLSKASVNHEDSSGSEVDLM